LGCGEAVLGLAGQQWDMKTREAEETRRVLIAIQRREKALW
jgi:hypothetical protein